MSPYIILIFGAHRVPVAVEVLECGTDDTATERAREYATCREAFGYEVWLSGHKVASSFSRSVLRPPGETNGEDIVSNVRP